MRRDAPSPPSPGPRNPAATTVTAEMGRDPARFVRTARHDCRDDRVGQAARRTTRLHRRSVGCPGLPSRGVAPHGRGARAPTEGFTASPRRQPRTPDRPVDGEPNAAAHDCQRDTPPHTWRRRGRSRIIAALFPPATDPRAHGPVHLHHESRREDRAPEARDPPRHLAQLLPRRQDRRARPERLGQVHAAADHGGRRQGVRRRGPAAARHQDRLPRAGAAARRVEGRPRQRRDGRRPHQGRPEAPRRGVCRLRRAGRRFREDRRRAGEARGADPGDRRPQSRTPARGRRGRAAPAALGGRRHEDLRRRAAPRGALPAAAVETRHAAARRAHQPPRCRVGALAGAFPRAIPGHRHRGDPRPLLPRQRRRLDPRTRPRLRHPVAGQLLLVARAEGKAARGRGAAAVRAQEDARARTRVGSPEPEGAAGQEQGAHAAFRGTAVARVPGAQRDQRDLYPARPPPRRTGGRGRRACPRPTARSCCSRTWISTCRRAASSASSARTVPARPRCSASSPGRRPPTPARSASDRRCSSRTWTSRASRSTTGRPSGRKSRADSTC